MVGTLRFAHPTDLTVSQTLPRRGKSAEYFPQNHGGRVFTGDTRRHASAAKKTRSAARKIAQIPAASSLPQDLPVQLMVGAARFGEPVLSTSRGLDFTSRRAGVVRRGASAHRTSASISTGFSTRPDVSPRHAA
jgi:hypothetical protein